jgi:hypothetical protein
MMNNNESTNSADEEVIKTAMWAGDTDTLFRLAPCRCCCPEHTYASCKARQWHGCLGEGYFEPDAEDWASYYEKTHGMTRKEFFGG